VVHTPSDAALKTQLNQGDSLQIGQFNPVRQHHSISLIEFNNPDAGLLSLPLVLRRGFYALVDAFPPNEREVTGICLVARSFAADRLRQGQICDGQDDQVPCVIGLDEYLKIIARTKDASRGNAPEMMRGSCSS
jgi:hypothetical protein